MCSRPCVKSVELSFHTSVGPLNTMNLCILHVENEMLLAKGFGVLTTASTAESRPSKSPNILRAPSLPLSLSFDSLRSTHLFQSKNTVTSPYRAANIRVRPLNPVLARGSKWPHRHRSPRTIRINNSSTKWKFSTRRNPSATTSGSLALGEIRTPSRSYPSRSARRPRCSRRRTTRAHRPPSLARARQQTVLPRRHMSRPPRDL